MPINNNKLKNILQLHKIQTKYMVGLCLTSLDKYRVNYIYLLES